MFVCCECCVFSGRGLCDGLITHAEEFYRLSCVVVCDQETSYARRLKPAIGLQNTNPHWVVAPVEKNRIYQITVYTSKKTYLFHITKKEQLVAFSEIISVNFEKV